MTITRPTIIKVGTDVVTTPTGRLDVDRIHNLVDQIMTIREQVGRVLLVTSGAMAAGRMQYNCVRRPDETDATKRMYAAAGQPLLQRTYEDHFSDPHKCVASQILLTREAFFSPERSKTLLETLQRIYEQEEEHETLGQPIFNENDPIANEEIKFSDNDELAALLAKLVKARRVVLLTGKVQGLMRDVDDDASVIHSVSRAEQAGVKKFVTSGKSANGTGGMELKFDHVCDLANTGIKVNIVNGKLPDVLSRLLIKKQRIGTLFKTT